MIEADARAHIPVARVKGVLDKRGLLPVRCCLSEVETSSGVRVELRRVGDGVLQRLVDGAEDSIRSELEIVVTIVPGQVGANISLPKSALLCRHNRRGQ